MGPTPPYTPYTPYSTYGAGYRVPPPPPSRGFPWLAVLGLFLLAALGAAAVGLALGGDDEDATTSAASRSDEQEQATTTTAPRVLTRADMERYCTNGPQKWTDVPVHRPEDPSRSEVFVVETGRSTRPFGDSATGGSTVVSPAVDGAFSADPSVRARTRSVTCVVWDSEAPTGEYCEYGDVISGYWTIQIVRQRYLVTMLELHSGGVMAKGEIFTRDAGCPDKAYVDGPTTAYPLTDSQILDWFKAHFPDGRPR